MFEALFGNQSIQRILIFLFVNSKCYGTQLHRALDTPLTPIQKALQRLETGGIIVSYCEGKTRIYQFNPAFPLREELEQLLKKAYTILPSQEKKRYYINKEESPGQRGRNFDKLQVLLAFWDKLTAVKRLSFNARTKSKEQDLGWNGKGSGQVSVTKVDGSTLTFTEKGTWRGKQGQEINFTNVFRWTLDRNTQLISLEHLRRGPAHPVFLFHLSPSGNRVLSSVDSHLCDGDIYFGQIHFDQQSLCLNWRVIGPKKNEEIESYYSH